MYSFPKLKNPCGNPCKVLLLRPYHKTGKAPNQSRFRRFMIRKTYFNACRTLSENSHCRDESMFSGQKAYIFRISGVPFLRMGIRQQPDGIGISSSQGRNPVSEVTFSMAASMLSANRTSLCVPIVSRQKDTSTSRQVSPVTQMHRMSERSHKYPACLWRCFRTLRYFVPSSAVPSTYSA